MNKPIKFYQVPGALATIEEQIKNSIDAETGEYTGDPADLAKQFHLANQAEVGLAWYAKDNRNLKANKKACEDDIEVLMKAIDEIAAPYREEIDSLLARLRAIDKRQEFIKDLSIELFHSLGIDEINDDAGRKIWIQKTTSVQVADDIELGNLDPKFVRITADALDKKAVRKAYESGEWTSAGVSVETMETMRFP